MSNAVDIQSIEYGTTSMTEVLYFTGGLVSRSLSPSRFSLEPLSRQGAIKFISQEGLFRFAERVGLTRVGVIQRFSMGTAPTEVWRPISIRDSAKSLEYNSLQSSDLWGAIAHHARAAGDNSYADLARYVSLSMRSAGLKLRDVAHRHHEQLCWALDDSPRPGKGFKNTAMFDLYSAFHSLVADLCSARDHLASIAASHIGARDSVDALARLENFLSKNINAELKAEKLTSFILEELGEKDKPGWLRQLGAMRNEMLHNRPMAANEDAQMFRLKFIDSEYGGIYTLHLGADRDSNGDVHADTKFFENLCSIFRRMELMMKSSSELARYPSEIPVFNVRRD